VSDLTTIGAGHGFDTLGPLPARLKGSTHHLRTGRVQNLNLSLVDIACFLWRVKALGLQLLPSYTSK